MIHKKTYEGVSFGTISPWFSMSHGEIKITTNDDVVFSHEWFPHDIIPKGFSIVTGAIYGYELEGSSQFF